VVRIETSLEPHALLAMAQAIESAFGRPAPGEGFRSGPRAMDVDILIFGDLTIDEPELQLPHPRLLRRAFVLRPLSDVLEGGWIRETEEEW
jgi:2-amino-4-hydroxy-6-hydroxymethyldihydropteridine diphosphokinase